MQLLYFEVKGFISRFISMVILNYLASLGAMLRKTMKTLLQTIGMFTLAFCSSSFAQTNSIYIAANAGIFAADFNQTYRDQTDIIPQNIASPSQQHGYTGGMAIGYRHLFCNNYFLGTELAGNFRTHSASFQSGAATSAFSDRIKINNDIDLSLEPGLMLNQSIAAYLKFGVARGSLEDHLTSPVGYNPEIHDYQTTKHPFGFTAGLGMTKSIVKNLGMFVEANYYDYGTVNLPNFQNFTADYTHTAHIYNYAVTLGLAYQFAL